MGYTSLQFFMSGYDCIQVPQTANIWVAWKQLTHDVTIRYILAVKVIVSSFTNDIFGPEQSQTQFITNKIVLQYQWGDSLNNIHI